MEYSRDDHIDLIPNVFGSCSGDAYSAWDFVFTPSQKVIVPSFDLQKIWLSPKYN